VSGRVVWCVEGCCSVCGRMMFCVWKDGVIGVWKGGLVCGRVVRCVEGRCGGCVEGWCGVWKGGVVGV